MRLRTWTTTGALALCMILHGACRRDTPDTAAADSRPGGPRPAPAPAERPQPGPQADPSLPADLAAIVAGHRQIIVLVEHGPTLGAEQQARADLAGRLLFQDTHHQAAALGEALLADLATSDRARVGTFLDALERHRDLRDADKLAFRDVVADLHDAARAGGSAVPPSLRTRIADDERALDEIQALYTKELERVFGRFRERGMPVRREAWEAYVAHLGTRYTAAAILEAQAPRLDVVLKTGRKGQAETPLEMSGQRLPLNHVALTFDDGPHPKYTDAIRAMLAERGIPAVFFHVGQNVGTVDAKGAITPTRAAAASRKLAGAGFTLANHSFSHQPMPGLSDRDIGEQIESTNRIVRAVLGSSPTLFRPPYGARDTRVLAAVQAQRMTSVLWNIDSKDWADPLPLSIADRVVKAFDSERRGIVLFHDIQRRTVEALPRILDELQKRGVRFVGWDGTGFSVPASAQAQTAATRAADNGPLYRESWAVVVGIDKYQHWPALAYAVNDAKAIREVLIRRYRFAPDHVTMLLDGEATRERILAAIGDRLTDPGRVKKDDRVFVFFAGHGTTRKLPSGKALGYLVPVDADLENYQSQAISMTNFQDASDAIPARHLFLVTDACYSGLALTRGGPQQYLREVTGRVARQVLTAGGADETVADNGPNGHSIFTWTLLQGLEGRADLSGDGFITASELAAYVGPLVSQVSRQTPAFGSLPGSEGGEFVFELQPETEFLSTLSTQLDDEAIRLNGELERLRASVADKQARNERLRQEVAQVRATGAGAAAPAPTRDADPTAAGLNDRGMALYREKRYAEALDAFLAATKADPRSALAANNAGFAYFRLGRHAEAVTWFERTIALDPQRAIAFVNLGDARLAQQQPAQARAAYERYLVLQPNSRLAAGIRQKLATL
jgi:peptidoglycan/xylan/chitin deacetylase (PgdA/CDA1 family)